MVWQSLLDIDKQLLLALNGDGGAGWDTFFYIVSARLTWVPLYAAILYAVWKQWGWRRLLWVAVVLGLCVGAADQICNFFKHFTPKFRPTHTPDIEAFVHTVRGYRGGLYGTVSAMRRSASRSRCSPPGCSEKGGIRSLSSDGRCCSLTAAFTSASITRWTFCWGRLSASVSEPARSRCSAG